MANRKRALTAAEMDVGSLPKWTEMRAPIARPLCLLASFALTGCMVAPPTVVSSGDLPTQGSFQLDSEGRDDAQELHDALEHRLQGRGLRPGEAPRYRVEMAQAERPTGTGITAPGEAQGWLSAPDLRHKRQRLATLTVSVFDVIEGREIYRISAQGRPRKSDRVNLWPSLLDAALPPAPSEAPIRPAAVGE